ncbi:MAG: hypothetical protein K2X11_15840 [Acetobacteraceae bacterium]|nr:hypothetical protein [Acetobacteraceae bacterium]
MIAPYWPLAGALLVAPLAVVLQNRALAPIALLGLAGTVGLALARGWRPSRPPALALPLGALLLWMAVAAFWAPSLGRGLDATWRLAATALLGLLAADALRHENPRPLGRATAIGVMIGLAAAALDHLTGNALRAGVRGMAEAPASLAFGLKNAAAILALFLPLAVMAARPAIGWAIGAAGAAVVLLLPGESAKLAALAGLGATALAGWRPRLTARLLGYGIAALILAGPWAMRAGLAPGLPAGHWPESAAHRLIVWDFAATRMAERPAAGFGMDSSRAIPGGTSTPDAATLTRFGIPETSWISRAQLLPLHPHNIALQVWLELGAIGALLLATLVLALARAAETNPAGSGALAAGTVIAMLSYGAWQYWWVAGLTLAALVAARGGR